MTIIGDGRYKYEVVEAWGNVPPGLSLGVVTGVVVDSQERVYFCQQQQDPPIMVFDRDGNFLDSWGSGFIREPHTMYLSPDDVLYLADRGDHVALKLTLDGQILLEMGNRGQPSDTGCYEDEAEVPRAAGPFNRPTRLSPSPLGDLYISDGYRNSRVHRFSGEGTLIASWGEPGTTAPGEFFSPHCLWIDPRGQVYVCDRKNNRIQIFSPTGEYNGQWDDVKLPTDLHWTPDGVIYVAEREGSEALDNFMSVRDQAGHALARWESPRCHQLWPTANGDIFLASGVQATPRNALATKLVRVP